LLFCGSRKWQGKTLFPGQVQGDARVFRSMRRGEDTAMLAVLHVFIVCFQHSRIGAGLGKNFTQHFQVKSQ
jgi:hypothetical protein